MEEFAIFWMLVLYNFELTEKHSSHNSQNTVGSHLENYDFYVFMHIIIFFCIIVKSELDNCFSGTKLTNMATFASLG